MSNRLANRDLTVVVMMLFSLAVPAAITLKTISERSPLVYKPETPSISPFGYSLSLLLFGVPSVVIAMWFLFSQRYDIERRSFFRTFFVGFAFGCLLDGFFGTTFLEFRNLRATLGLNLPAFTPGQGFGLKIPVEEFLFYALGFITILLVYIWSDVYWFSAYHADELSREAKAIPRLIRLHWNSAFITAALILAAVAYKHLGPHAYHEGFPGYFTFLVLAGALPAMLFFPNVKLYINWRALSLTLFVILFISLLWEVTLGVPYAWWGYRDTQMMGLFIEAWAHLPIEAVFVWIAAVWGTVITYEVFRIRLHMDRSLVGALLGESLNGEKGFLEANESHSQHTF